MIKKFKTSSHFVTLFKVDNRKKLKEETEKKAINKEDLIIFYSDLPEIFKLKLQFCF